MVDPAVNYRRRVDTPRSFPLKIAFIARLLADWSTPSCPPAGPFVKDSLIKKDNDIYRKPPYIIAIELS